MSDPWSIQNLVHFVTILYLDWRVESRSHRQPNVAGTLLISITETSILSTWLYSYILSEEINKYLHHIDSVYFRSQ